MIRTMIVDDEPLAREELARLVKQNDGFEIVEEASNGTEALQKLKKAKIDVVFLDIEMPGLTGLEVASKLADWPKPPLVVFATAYQQYAVQAFETHAIDYILKPYDEQRLRKTLSRIKELVSSQASERGNLVALDDELIRKGMIKKVIGYRRKTKDRIVINPTDVYYFHVHYSEILARLEAEELIVRVTLKELMDSLEPSQFAQTHKSYLVNLDKIEKVSPMFSGNFEISLKHSSLPKIPLSRRFSRALKERLGGW